MKLLFALVHSFRNVILSIQHLAASSTITTGSLKTGNHGDRWKNRTRPDVGNAVRDSTTCMASGTITVGWEEQGTREQMDWTNLTQRTYRWEHARDAIPVTQQLYSGCNLTALQTPLTLQTIPGSPRQRRPSNLFSPLKIYSPQIKLTRLYNTSTTLG